MSIGSIKDKFVKPFGPYVVHEILDCSAIRRYSQDKFNLESVSLRLGTKQVGCSYGSAVCPPYND